MMALTYQEWSVLFGRFAAGEDIVLDEMEVSSYSLDAGVATRFCVIAEEAYRQRKTLWLKGFNSSIQFQRLKYAGEFEWVLGNAKATLSPLVRFVNSKGLPDELKKVFVSDLDIFLNEVKNGLRDKITRTSVGGETILIMLNNWQMVDGSDRNNVADKNLRKDPYNTGGPESIGRKIIF